MLRKWMIVLLLEAAGISPAFCQKLMGLVVEKSADGKDQPLPGANVYWSGTTAGTTTRENGVFMIDRVEGNSQLIISYVGYRADTVNVTGQSNVKVELVSDQVLEEVTVQGWRASSRIDHASGINVVVMDEKELFKAACCNLSESFETNPAVDVAFTDGVTGTRQIQMLGLSGSNTMISLENMPGIRGLASSQGIQFIPGTWINSIQVTKGVGSVVNGYESIAGQINVELKKPQESDKLYINGYLNNSGRSEMNFIFSGQTGKKWATTILLHGSVRPKEVDHNHDTFLDLPTGSQVNLINRWTYNSNGWLGQLSFKYLRDGKVGGQTNFDRALDKFTTNRYGLEINTERAEFTGKLGYQFPSQPYRSIGLQVNGFVHDHKSYFGFNEHNAREKSIYGNLIYQSIIGSTAHKFKTGVSFMVDDYDEVLDQRELAASYDFGRTEIVPGAFLEYNYDAPERFSLIAGLRADYHNLFGVLFVPRVHLRYDLTKTTTARLSAGRGIRVANIIAENSGVLASSRAVVLSGLQTNQAYGFKPDKAWNYGLSLAQEFTLDYRPGTLSADYFFTDFENQVVIDYDHNPREINIFGLTGKSFSHSFQVQVDYQLVRRLDLRLAYRKLSVQTDYLDGSLRRPMIPGERAFANLAYKTKSRWYFDYTVQRIGQQRLPSTLGNPLDHRLPSLADPYWVMNAQVTKDFGANWSLYAGVENLTNFKLEDPIIGAHDPFGTPYFDGSLVWGPVFGRMWYGGFRYRIN